MTPKDPKEPTSTGSSIPFLLQFIKGKTMKEAMVTTSDHCVGFTAKTNVDFKKLPFEVYHQQLDPDDLFKQLGKVRTKEGVVFDMKLVTNATKILKLLGGELEKFYIPNDMSPLVITTRSHIAFVAPIIER